MTKSAPKRAERFDIVIPNNSVRVQLLANHSREKVDGVVSLVSYQDDSADDVAHFARRYPARDGEATIAHIVTSTEIALCGEAEGYERRCLPRFRIGATENRNVEIELTRAVRWEGRIALQSPIEYGRLWFVNDHGALTEWCTVASDGKFMYKMPHTARDYVVLTGSLPLAVLPWPTTVTGATVDLSYPAGRRRELTVQRTDTRAGDSLIGLTIGESVIPTEAFSYHQGLRGANYTIAPGQPLPISDILESAPISVILGPELNAEQFPADVDWLSVIPYVRSRPRMALSPSGTVTFDQ